MNKESVLQLTRVLSFWVMFVAFASGAVIGNLYLWAPQLFKGPAQGWGAYARAMGASSVSIPPFSWFQFTVEQLMLFGVLLDVVGIVGLFVSPKISASVVFGMAAWRYIVMRTMKSPSEIPKHPLCGFQSPHCPQVDLLRLTVIAAAVVGFMSKEALPGVTMKLMKQMGVDTNRIENLVNRVTGGAKHQQAHQITTPAGGGSSRKDL